MSTRSRRLNSGSNAATSTKNMTSRFEKLEENLQVGLKELKDQLLNEAPKTPTEVNSIMEKITTFEKKAFESLAALKTILHEALDGQKQEYNLNIVVVNGIAETDDENLYEVIPKFISKKLQINITDKDIDYSYRIGKKNESQKPRPIAVRFVNRWLRDKVFYVKKNLKGSGIVLTEYLVNKIQVLYKKVREMVGPRNCWTFNARIYVSINNTKKTVRNIQELEELLKK